MFKKIAIAASLALVSGLAAASEPTSGVDVSEAVGVLSGDGSDAIKQVGGAMLGLAGLAVTFKWAKAAFFG